MAVVDASIPLSAEATTIDPGRAFTLAAMAQQMRQQQQQAQGQNALKQIFANPQNIDQTGGLTANALRQIMAIEPFTGMKYQEEQLRINEQKLKRADEIHGLIDPVRDSALNAYDDVLKSGGSQDAANAAGQRALDEGLAPLRSSGLLSNEERGQLRSKFEYGPMKASALSYKERLAQSEKEKADTREDTRLGFEKERVGIEESHLQIAKAAAGRAAQTFKEEHEGLGLLKDPAALDEATQRYMGTGKFQEGTSHAEQMAIAHNAPVLRAKGVEPLGQTKDISAPQAVTVKKPDGTTEMTEAVYDKQGKQWLTAQGGKPIDGTVMPAKEARAEAGVISDETADFIADRILAGDPNATRNMSRTKESMVKVEDALTRKATQKYGAGARAAAEVMIAQAGVKADTHSLLNIQKMSDAAVSFEQTASKNFDLALSLADKAVPTNWGPFINRWIENGETFLGNKDVPPYVAAMLTGANEYAKIMSGSTGAQGSTVDSRKEAAELFSPYLSKGQIEEVVKIAKRDMNNRKASLSEQIGVIKDRMGGEAEGRDAKDKNTPLDVKAEAESAWGSYEPDKYEYGINPQTGKFARRPKQ